MASKKKGPVIGQAAQLERLIKQAFIAVGLGIALLIISMAANFLMSSVQSEQLEVTMALNQYRNGSKTLTSEVQSYAVTGQQLYYDNYMNELNVAQNREKAIATLKEYDITDEEWKKFDAIAELSNGLVPLEEAAMAAAASGDLKAAQENVFGEVYEQTVVQISEQTEEVISQIQDRKAGQKTLFQILQMVAQFAFIASCAYVIYSLVKTISFSKKELLLPIEKVAEQMGHLAHGDFSVRMDLEEDASEVGQMVAAIRFMKKNMSEMIAEISSILGEMGEGNYQFTIEKEYVGEFVAIKDSIIKIGEAMRETLHTLRDVAEQIDGGSEQLACAAQDLAEGSTIQATQVAEVAEAIKRMAESMLTNAEAAEQSVEIASDAGKTLVSGNEKMQELKTAIQEISKCSEEIGTIINAIEDIAEQTNLLSLNAAIEAARAGEAGRGFAVVAEQVKNLAEESAKAAGKTTQLIQMTIDAVTKGIDIADATAANMTEVMGGAMEATEKMGQIAKMLDEEAANMQVINETVASVSTVVDNNSATSQETAAVSEEQKAQVETMVQMMTRFKI
jgi:methyl-accepting chemotaxis protein